MFDEFDRYLSNEWNVDYWYDIGVIQAIDLLDNFLDHDWQKLLHELPTKQEMWMCRCAETLGDVEDPIAFVVLEKLMETSSHDLLMAVVDSVRSQAYAGRRIKMTVGLQSVLVELRRSAGRIDRMVISDLEKILISSDM